MHDRDGFERTRLARLYFAVQAVGVAAWWIVLWLVPSSRSLFAAGGFPFAPLGAFAPGDLGMIALGSAAIAWRGDARWSTAVAWIVAGAMAYAAIYTVTAALIEVMTIFAAVTMVAGAVASIAAARVLTRSRADALSSGPVA